MPVPDPIRLMLVDDHAILRAGLANLLNGEAGMQVVAVADDGESAPRSGGKCCLTSCC